MYNAGIITAGILGSGLVIAYGYNLGYGFDHVISGFALHDCGLWQGPFFYKIWHLGFLYTYMICCLYNDDLGITDRFLCNQLYVFYTSVSVLQMLCQPIRQWYVNIMIPLSARRIRIIAMRQLYVRIQISANDHSAMHFLLTLRAKHWLWQKRAAGWIKTIATMGQSVLQRKIQ